MQTYDYRTPSDIVQDEGANRYSRDEDVLASGSGIVVTGTVLGMVTASGKVAPLAPAANDGTETAVGIILETADATSADQDVVALKRRAQVVSQALVWPAGITTGEKATATAELESLGIIARNGV